MKMEIKKVEISKIKPCGKRINNEI